MKEHKKAAVLFPGIGYTCDKPLLYYTAKYLNKQGYDVIPVPYKNFPKGVKGNPEKMEKAFHSALSQSEEILSCVDFKEYEEILFVSKSVGTVVSTAYAKKHHLKARNILFTPIAATFDFTGKLIQKQDYRPEDLIAFHGTSDPWAETEEIIRMAEEQKIPLHLYENCNHSLECGEIETDIQNLSEIMKTVIRFI